jgi:hypothetical protein
VPLLGPAKQGSMRFRLAFIWVLNATAGRVVIPLGKPFVI